MRIAQIAPLIESVPPRLYGGTERVVSWLTEELVRLGHEVTLFASADSETSATLVPCVPAALRFEPRCDSPLPHYMVMFEQLRRRRRDFDFMHFHIDYLHYPLMRGSWSSRPRWTGQTRSISLRRSSRSWRIRGCVTSAR